MQIYSEGYKTYLVNDLDNIRGSYGDDLAGKKIALCVTGSISCYRAPDLARHLIRYGADVVPVMSRDAAELLSPEVLRWATGNEPIVKISGEIEHVSLTEGKDRVDLVLIAPATASTIAKIASGVSDTPVTLVASCAIGEGIPLLIVPAMHQSMYRNEAVSRALEELRRRGVAIVPPIIEEGKAKLPSPEEILDFAVFALTKKDMDGIRCIVTAGATREYIDPIRYISNPSSGKMGLALAKEIWSRGGEVKMVTGHMTVDIPRWIDHVHVETSREMTESILKVMSDFRPQAFFSAGAVTDYRPAVMAAEKIDTSRFERIGLELVATEKVVRKVRKEDQDLEIVLFRAVTQWPPDPFRELERYSDVDPLLIIINNVRRSDAGFASDFNDAIIVTRSGKVREVGRVSKRRLAREVVSCYLSERGK